MKRNARKRNAGDSVSRDTDQPTKVFEFVVENDMPLRLSSRPSLKMLDRRLDELALPSKARHRTCGRALRSARKSLYESENRRRRLTQHVGLDQRDVVETRQSRWPVPVNRRTRRRKFTTSHTCLHSRGVRNASRGEVQRTLTSG